MGTGVGACIRTAGSDVSGVRDFENSGECETPVLSMLIRHSLKAQCQMTVTLLGGFFWACLSISRFGEWPVRDWRVAI